MIKLKTFVETDPLSLWLSNTLFERLFLPEKMTNYKTSTVVSHKHEFLMVVITTEHMLHCLSNNMCHLIHIIFNMRCVCKIFMTLLY